VPQYFFYDLHHDWTCIQAKAFITVLLLGKVKAPKATHKRKNLHKMFDVHQHVPGCDLSIAYSDCTSSQHSQSF